MRLTPVSHRRPACAKECEEGIRHLDLHQFRYCEKPVLHSESALQRIPGILLSVARKVKNGG